METKASRCESNSTLRRLPYLGILFAQGYGPVERDLRGLFIALEATTGMGENLEDCRGTDTSTRLGREVYRFQIKLSLLKRTGLTVAYLRDLPS